MTEETHTIGRPKSETASSAIMAEALRMMRRDGYDKVSISALAKAAGVARQTLYNRWATKAELVLDAFFNEAATETTPPDLASDRPRRELLAEFLTEILEHLSRDGDTLRALIGAAQADPDFRAKFWDRFVRPRGEVVEALLRDAVQRGELDDGRDIDLLVTFVHGAFWYRLLNGQTLDKALARAIADDIFLR